MRFTGVDIAMLIGVFVVGGWAWENPPTIFFDAARAWSQGSIMPVVSTTEKAGIEAMNAVRRLTPAGSKILPTVLDLEVRYSALRPIAYAYKDGEIFADTNLGALSEWNRARQEMESISVIKDDSTKLQKLLDLGARLHADYLLVDFPVDSAAASHLKAQVVWSNGLLALVRTAV
jgi:hypothetical protein